MKVRAVANGNIIDLPEGHGLILAGIYEPVEEDEPPDPDADALEPVFRPAAGLDVKPTRRARKRR